MRALAFLGVFVAACACTTPSSQSAAPADVCKNLTKLGCSIGSSPECVASFTAAVETHHATSAQLACVSAATSKSAAVACTPDGYITCP